MTFRGSLQDIRLFVAAYEERSFSSAARRENSSQSGVSHHIRQLEQLLNVTLFVRDRNGVVATPAADIFYRETVETLRGIDRATTNLSLYAKGFQGQFSIAVSPAVAHRLVTPALLHFNSLYPNVRTRIVESIPDQMPQMIKSGEIDLAISAAYESDPGIKCQHLLSAPECLVTGAHSATTQISGTINLVLPMLKERRRAAVIDSLQAQKLRIAKIVEIDSALTILDLVSRSDWKTVAPCLVADPASKERLNLRPLRDSGLMYKVILLEPSASVLPPGAAEFVELLKKEAMHNVDQWGEIFARFEPA